MKEIQNHSVLQPAISPGGRGHSDMLVYTSVKKKKKNTTGEKGSHFAIEQIMQGIHLGV